MIAQQRSELLSRGSDEEMQIMQYVGRMRRKGEWGTGLEALCAAYRYDRLVHVWSPGGFSELRPPHSRISAQNLRPETIRLLHNGHNHWDSLADGGSAPSSSAKVPEGLTVPNEDDSDAVLAFALSASLQGEEDPEVTPFFVAKDEHQDLRRALAASAAEERQRLYESRGLAGYKTRMMQVMPQCLERGAAEAHEEVQSAMVHGTANPEATTIKRNRWTRRLAQAENDTAQERAPHTCNDVVLIEVMEENARLGSDASQKHVESLTGDLHPEKQECIAALCRIGFSQGEAIAILAESEFDIDQVRLLYAIDWDNEGRTVQRIFE